MRILKHVAANFAALGVVTPLMAQDPTVEDYLQLFNKHLEVREQPLTRSLAGNQGRGLTPITVENVQVEPVVIEADSKTAGGTHVTSTAPSQIQQTGTDDTIPEFTNLGSHSETAVIDIAKTDLKTPTSNHDTTPFVYAQLAQELQISLQISFDFDSAVLTKIEESKLTTLCAAMKASDVRLFRIIGHTDTSGADEYNQRLSTLRAKEVARHLVQGCGITATRLETVGLGERFPVNASDTRADENRRVEFQALS
ncbi:MAG: OmpA family protein [Litoreibacter sp.]